MFITTPMFEFRVPAGLGPPESKYWRATSLTLFAPLYVLWWQAQPDELNETMLVAEEETLHALVQQMSPGQCISLQVISPNTQRPTWQMQRVIELWLPLDDEREDSGPLLMRLAGHRELFGRYMQAFADRPGRKLLVRPVEQT